MKYILIILLSITVFACNSDSSIKQKELELKEKELALKERELNLKTDSINKISKAETKKERKLRYLYSSNGGLMGFYSDGSVSACPRCDLLKENIKAMNEMTPHARYQNEENGLLVDGKDLMEFNTDGEISHEWVLMNYVWTVDVIE